MHSSDTRDVHRYAREHGVKLGVSACLLGQRVRYNGNDKWHRGVVEELGAYVGWVPVCPEVELGLGVPREPIELVRSDEHERGVRLVGTQSGRDLTEAMSRLARARVAELSTQGIAGYVLKSKSPSCGLHVKVFATPALYEPERPDDEPRIFDAIGPGLFAAALQVRFPGMPLAEEIELDSKEACTAFLQRVCAYHEASRA